MKKFKLGTGSIVAAAFIGPGTVTVCSAAGANFGYHLLWVLLFSVIATIVLQEMVIRISITNQKDLAAILSGAFQNTLLQKLISFLAITAIFVGSVAYESGNIAGAAAALDTSFGNFSIGSINGYGIVIGLIAAILLGIGKYKFIERTLIGLVIFMSVVFLTTAIAIGPSYLGIIKGLFIPSIPEGSLLLTVGLLGTTIVPYNLFLQSSALINSGNLDYTENRSETIFSIGVGGLISMAILITGSVIFYNSDLSLSQLSDIAIQLEPLLGTWSRPFMALGFFAAGISSAITAPLAAAYTVCGILRWNQKDWKFKAVWALAIISGILFYSTGIKPLILIQIAQATNGLLLPIIGIILLWLMNKTDLMKGAKNSMLSNVVGIVVILIVTILSVKSLLSVFGIL